MGADSCQQCTSLPHQELLYVTTYSTHPLTPSQPRINWIKILSVQLKSIKKQLLIVLFFVTFKLEVSFFIHIFSVLRASPASSSETLLIKYDTRSLKLGQCTVHFFIIMRAWTEFPKRVTSPSHPVRQTWTRLTIRISLLSGYVCHVQD